MSVKHNTVGEYSGFFAHTVQWGNMSMWRSGNGSGDETDCYSKFELNMIMASSDRHRGWELRTFNLPPLAIWLNSLWSFCVQTRTFGECTQCKCARHMYVMYVCISTEGRLSRVWQWIYLPCWAQVPLQTGTRSMQCCSQWDIQTNDPLTQQN